MQILWDVFAYCSVASDADVVEMGVGESGFLVDLL